MSMSMSMCSVVCSLVIVREMWNVKSAEERSMLLVFDKVELGGGVGRRVVSGSSSSSSSRMHFFFKSKKVKVKDTIN